MATEDSPFLSNQPETRPNPDPTNRTTEELLRAIANVKEQLRGEVLALKDSIETRLKGYDKATDLLREHQEKVPSETDKAIAHLRDIIDQKFESIEKRFAERDARSDQAARDNKANIDTAFLNAKDAVREQNANNSANATKTETFMTKQFDQMTNQITKNSDAAGEWLNDIRIRVAALEGQRSGGDHSNQMWIAMGGLLLASLVAMGAFAIHSAAPAPQQFQQVPQLVQPIQPVQPMQSK